MPRVSTVPPATTRPQGNRLALLLVVTATVLIVATLGARPLIHHWRSVEAPLQTARAQVGQLQAMLGSQRSADSLALRREQELAQLPQRVLRARSRSLAASALQSMVLEFAESSNVTITRLDVAQPDSTGDLPFDLSANGDIYGLADLLQRIRTARYVVVVRKLRVQNNSALRGARDVLQIALSLQAPVIVQ